MSRDTIIYPLHNGSQITVSADAFESSMSFAKLAELCALPTTEKETETAEFQLFITGDRERPDLWKLKANKRSDIYWDQEQKTVHYLLESAAVSPADPNISAFWRLCLTYAVLAAILRDKPVSMLHCTMLETPAGGVILCGESGIGKSTTSRRFRAIGGRCTADDMILLEQRNDGFYAYPLPTWSACAEKIEGKCYPFAPVKVKDILFLTRGGDNEEILPIQSVNLQAQVYRGLFFHLYHLVKYFPENQQMKIMHSIRKLSEDAANTFTPRALYANLQGDLKKTLEEYL